MRSASLAASRLFLIPFKPSVPTQIPVLGCHLSATQLPIIPAVDPILQGTPTTSKWATALHLPRLLIFQTPYLLLGSGKDGFGLEGFASRLVLQSFPISSLKLML